MKNDIGNSKIKLEIPFEKRDAKKRGISSSFCRMIVEFPDGKEGCAQLEQCINLWRPEEKEIIGVAMNEFVSPSRKNEAGIMSKEIGGFSTIRTCSLNSMLFHWDAEAHVFFYSSEQDSKRIIESVADSERRWWKFSRGGHEPLFLKQIDTVGVFLFFERSHMSLEIIGKKTEVFRCFDVIRQFI
jgi:hypothetical protein